MTMTPTQTLVMRLVSELGQLTHHDLMDAYGWSRQHACRVVQRMREAGLLQVVDWRRGKSAKPLPVYGKPRSTPEPERPPAFTQSEKSTR